ncbi:hypothetical protein GCM10009555_083510 [Acrocarpospora macrocephala]|uniref:Uncharacterized protein n=1 Tax=Acrocarpospora macrocephala TaxID=150177 RepID=A0A5M3X2R6_9ACTN|nr:hypothetical protein Amac_089270 [Acrocarpospora macrocephala]
MAADWLSFVCCFAPISFTAGSTGALRLRLVRLAPLGAKRAVRHAALAASRHRRFDAVQAVVEVVQGCGQGVVSDL